MSTVAQPSNLNPQLERTRFVLVHGDKGGVGKSFVAQAIVDCLGRAGSNVSVIDADTANADVARMFGNSRDCIEANINGENGWMEIMDFIVGHRGHTVVMNTPAGAGQFMVGQIQSLARYLSGAGLPVEMELWWTMNAQHDSVNLLGEAFSAYGEVFKRVRVVCNSHFSDGKSAPFFLWNESQLRASIEKQGGMTILFPGLNLRVVGKIFDPAHMMPFSQAADAAVGEAVGLTGSERWKLGQWLEDVENLLRPAFASA